MEEQQLKFTPTTFLYPILIVMSIWVVFWAEIRFGFRLNDFGIQPKTVKGLRGVIFSPFIHSGISHLYHNTIPLFVLSAALFFFYRAIAWRVLVLGLLVTGILTWAIGRPSYHIGASGVIYMLVSFLFFKGIFVKHYRLIALSLLVVFLYGSMIWYVLPVEVGVSWEGHLSGFIVGFALAFVFKSEIIKPPKYDWEKEDYNEEEDAFLQHFDENGNFIEKVKEEDNESPSIDVYEITYNYIYKESNSHSSNEEE